MTRLVVTRALQAIPTLLLISLVAFGLVALAPVDPARMALSGGVGGVQLDERDVAAKRTELGLDRSLPERYVRWWADLIQLDFGRSFASGRPVSALLTERLPASVVLGLLALLVSVAVSLPLGIASALRAGGLLDQSARLVALLGASLPGFWLALILIWLFAVQLKWVPALGSFTPLGIILPTLVLAVRPLGRQLRLMRATTLDALAMDYLTVAKAKGLGRGTLVRRHVLPNAVLPMVTVVGLDLPALVSSAVVVEFVFAWPGIGRLAADAALAGDAPVLMAFVLLVGVLVVASSFAVDVVSGAIDPRQRLGATATT
jgi:ABC-type dipeptide/oligopeptide/nickel transport system permease component